MAKDVKTLDGNRTFENAVKKGTYDKWALLMSKKFDDSKVGGTPNFVMNGKKLKVEGAPPGTPIVTPQQFNTAVDNALKSRPQQRRRWGK